MGFAREPSHPPAGIPWPLMDAYDRQKPLLDARVPPHEVTVGRAYVIHARNGGVGVAVRDEDGRLGYRLRRVKFDRIYLFTEWDWDEGEPFGTAIPMALVEELPPESDDVLLDWLKARQEEHQERIDAAWRVVLGDAVFDSMTE